VVELARAIATHPAVHRVDLLTRLVKDPKVGNGRSSSPRAQPRCKMFSHWVRQVNPCCCVRSSELVVLGVSLALLSASLQCIFVADVVAHTDVHCRW